MVSENIVELKCRGSLTNKPLYVAGSFISRNRDRKKVLANNYKARKGNMLHFVLSVCQNRESERKAFYWRLRIVCDSLVGGQGVFIKTLPAEKAKLFFSGAYPILTIEHNGSWAVESGQLKRPAFNALPSLSSSFLFLSSKVKMTRAFAGSKFARWQQVASNDNHSFTFDSRPKF